MEQPEQPHGRSFVPNFQKWGPMISQNSQQGRSPDGASCSSSEAALSRKNAWKTFQKKRWKDPCNDKYEMILFKHNIPLKPNKLKKKYYMCPMFNNIYIVHVAKKLPAGRGCKIDPWMGIPHLQMWHVGLEES